MTIFVAMDRKQIKKLLDDNGVKYSFIAKKVGVSNVTVTYWLNGKSDIPTKRLEQIKEILKIYDEK